MTDLTTGMLTCLVTPAVRALARDYLASSDSSELVSDRAEVLHWLSEQESPNGTVLDASSAEEDALMIAVIAQAILFKYTWSADAAEAAADADAVQAHVDEHIRLIARG